MVKRVERVTKAVFSRLSFFNLVTCLLCLTLARSTRRPANGMAAIFHRVSSAVLELGAFAAGKFWRILFARHSRQLARHPADPDRKEEASQRSSDRFRAPR